MPTACLCTAFVLVLLDRRGKSEETAGMLKCKRICAGITTAFGFVMTGMLIFGTSIAGVCSID